MSKLCAECEYFEVRDVPDEMNEGHAVCKKYDLITDLIGKTYMRKVKRLSCQKGEKNERTYYYGTAD